MTRFAEPASGGAGVGLAAPEPRVLAPFGRRCAAITSNEPCGVYRLVGVDDPDGPAPLPGQFYMLAAMADWGGGGAGRPYLGRAFSICRASGGRLDFLVEELGPGTQRLAALAPGEELWLVGPLGVGFSEPAALAGSGERAGALLVGGGAGVAPLVIWERALLDRGVPVRTLLGFRSSAHCAAAELLASDVAIATDDGSVGHHGLVTDLLEPELEGSGQSALYACGPPRMLEAVRRICAERALPAELAMEEAMACGFGACFGCVVATTRGYRRLCLDGPVIAAADLDPDWLHE